MKDDWAFVVGINHYPFAGVDELEGAVYDANEFFKWVTDPKGGNVPVDADPTISHALLLTSPADRKQSEIPRPTVGDVRSFFDQMLFTLGNNSGRRLYLYLSGHGISPLSQEAIRNAALLMANARTPNLWPNFAGNLWAEGARSAARFREVVLIMDCCRDLKNNAPIDPHPFGEPVVDGKAGRLIEAYATEWASTARELPFPPKMQKRGVFTYSLLEVLRSGQMNGRLFKESVKTHLLLTLKDEKKAQVPEIGKDEDLAEITFNEQADPPSTSVAISGDGGNKPIVEFWRDDDQSVPVVLDNWIYDGAAWRGSLQPGIYEVRSPAGGARKLHVYAGVPIPWPEVA